MMHQFSNLFINKFHCQYNFFDMVKMCIWQWSVQPFEFTLYTIHSVIELFPIPLIAKGT